MHDRYRDIVAAFRWQVPPRFNIATACCARWAGDASRVALLWEDESGARATIRYAQLQRDANRLANALAAMGVQRGDRVAILLAQRPETAVAHLAAYQLGAVAMPLSVLFGPEALAYRLRDSGAVAAIVEPASLPNLDGVRAACPALRHVIGVAGANEAYVTPWQALLERASDAHACADTAASDPAVLIYTSGTTGPPKGALMPHQALIGNMPGFEHSQDGFPRAGDLFWSPADWAWTGGLMDALLPTLFHGQAILGYRGRFDPEHAFGLMERHGVTNSFLFPTALKMMMKALPRPRDRHRLRLRAMMSAGESVGQTVFDWCRESLGVTVNEMFGQTEINYIVGNSQALWPALPGSIGRPYPGHRVAVIDAEGNELPAGEVGEVACLDGRRVPGTEAGLVDPVFFLGYWNDPQATEAKYTGAWCRTGDLATRDGEGNLWYQGRADDVFKSAGYRIGPSEIENCLLRHPAVANAAVVPSPDPERGAVVKAYVVATPGHAADDALVAALQAHVRDQLAPYEYPKEIEFIDALPMTTTGKVQRRVLREREAARKRDAAATD
jgi:acetyl-CoA synthetase